MALGRHLNAPIVGITSMPIVDWQIEPLGNPLNPSYMSSVFSGSNQRMTFRERLKNTLITHFITNLVHYYKEAELKHVEQYFGRKLGSVKELYKDISILLTNEHYSINAIKPTTPDIIGVGGLHVFDDNQQLSPVRNCI